VRRSPYTDAIGSHGAKEIEGSDGYWRKFPDPFDKALLAASRGVAAERYRLRAGESRP
jgi:hypothetical protein